MTTLIVCPGCARHVRRAESQCPFCRSVVPLALRRSPERALPVERLTRSRLVAFAAVGIGVAACGGTVTDRTEHEQSGSGGGVVRSSDAGWSGAGGRSGDPAVPAGGWNQGYNAGGSYGSPPWPGYGMGGTPDVAADAGAPTSPVDASATQDGAAAAPGDGSASDASGRRPLDAG